MHISNANSDISAHEMRMEGAVQDVHGEEEVDGGPGQLLHTVQMRAEL